MIFDKVSHEPNRKADLRLCWVLEQCCHASGKSQGNLNFFKVRELSGNSANSQGNLE